ncbi:ribosome biogenesis GTPase Der [Buchnera aphidicola (Chaitoregma tattakana)]|uniref:ribosome biogenesis GTPase Der n=1 Tax=Buchnera aphidicola TaxID=9 RepID=UPI0031B8ACAE
MFGKYVSLIGRTNVGKSSLFNIFLNRNISTTTNYKNFSVDSNVACLRNNSMCILISDTAGIREFSGSSLEHKINKNIFCYIFKSNLLLFVINACDGITSLDINIANILRKSGKDVFLIVNKSENFNFSSNNLEFYSLGFKNIFFTSCNNISGVKKLLYDHITPFLKKNNFLFDCKKHLKNFCLLNNNTIIKRSCNDTIKISILGKPNVGKSTFINSLLNKDRLITDNLPGTTTDSTEVSFFYRNKKYVFIDTAGSRRSNKNVSKKEYLSSKIAIRAIKNSYIVMFIVDSTIKISFQDISLIHFIISLEKFVFIVINKWDLLNKNKKRDFRYNLKNFLKKIINVDYFFISAKKKINLFSIFKAIDNINKLAKKDYTPSILTNILNIIVSKHKPPLFNKKKIRLKYANLISNVPFRILIHGNRVEGLLSSYKKYLVNSFIKHLKLKGITLKIFFKKNDNPYI